MYLKKQWQGDYSALSGQRQEKWPKVCGYRWVCAILLVLPSANAKEVLPLRGRMTPAKNETICVVVGLTMFRFQVWLGLDWDCCLKKKRISQQITPIAPRGTKKMTASQASL